MIPTIRRGGAGEGAREPGADWDDEQAPAPRRWSKDDVRAWRAENPPISPWRVVAAQAMVGLACAAATWMLTQRVGAVWSALYGAVAVVLPSALLARGMTRGTRTPVAAAAGFMFWEMLKIGVAVALLAIAARVVPHLSWPALLVTMVVCIKVNWVALRWRGRRSDKKA